MNSNRKRSQQTHFSGQIFNTSSEFGGSLSGKGHAKRARPLSTKHAMHVVLRSSQAKGAWSLRAGRNIKMIQRELNNLSKKYGIRIYKYAIVGNHVHLLIKLANRFTFAPFMRALTGIIALKVTGANKLAALAQSFWDFRPWTRIVAWGKAYDIAKGYVVQNEQEACGTTPYRARSKNIKNCLSS